MSVRRSREPNLVTASTPHLQSVKALFKRNPLAAALSTGGFPLRASPSTFEDSGRDGREAEGTGLLNRHTWKRVSRVRIPLSPLGGSAHAVDPPFFFARPWQPTTPPSRGSASPRHPPATSTSAARGLHCSTGCTPENSAVSSFSVSRTPTKRAAPTRAPARSSREWSGSASTGTTALFIKEPIS